MSNLFGSNDLPAACAYDSDRAALADAQKEAWLEYTDANFITDISAALNRISKSIVAVTGSIQARLAKPAPAIHSHNLRHEVGD